MRGQRTTGHGFPCPLCKGKTATLDTRSSPTGTRRRKKCVECDHRFTTWESLQKEAAPLSEDRVLALAADALRTASAHVMRKYLDAVE